MSENSDYDSNFYQEIEDGSRRSALAAVPRILDLVPAVQSIVDFGCGSGVWLAEFERAGVPNIYGLDFGTGVDAKLAIKADRYRSTNLGAPVQVARTDLCVSLEVAEHVASEFSETFVDNLTNAAPRVLFSAAVPDQMGHHHINEQAPEYWIEKFKRRGYFCIDVVRPLLWEDERICWWYRQNMMLFVHESLSEEITALSSRKTFNGAFLIHPGMFDGRHKWLMNALNQLSAMPTSPTYGNATAEDENPAYLALARLVRSSFWKMTRPLHRFSTAAKRVNKLGVR